MTPPSHDTYINLYEMGARWYSPALGRWLSPDTIVPDQANPQSLNRYSYVRNNPLKYVDPSGHREIECDPGEPGCGANGRYANRYDLTSYLAGAMTTHGNDPRLADIYDDVTLKNRLWERYYPSRSGAGASWAGTWAGGYTKFLGLEGTKKEWDIKQKILRDLKEGVILCGEVCDWYDYSTPGNIHFGYVAGLGGIDHGIAAAMGGLAQTIDDRSVGKTHRGSIFADDPEDQAAVDFGYYLAGKYGNELTAADLRKELTVSWTSQFQRPPSTFQPPYPATPGGYYGPNRFNWP